MKTIRNEFDFEDCPYEFKHLFSLLKKYKTRYGEDYKDHLYKFATAEINKHQKFDLAGRGRDRIVLTDGSYVYKIDKNPLLRWNRREVRYYRRARRTGFLDDVLVPMVGRLAVYEDQVVNVFYKCQPWERSKFNREKIGVMQSILYDLRPCNLMEFQGDLVCVDPRVRPITDELSEKFNERKQEFIEKHGKWTNSHFPKSHLGYL